MLSLYSTRFAVRRIYAGKSEEKKEVMRKALNRRCDVVLVSYEMCQQHLVRSVENVYALMCAVMDSTYLKVTAVFSAV